MVSTADLSIRQLQAADIPAIVAAFAAVGWRSKTTAQYERYLAEQGRGERVTLVAWLAGSFAGYLNVLWQSHYPPFLEAQVPEINDFNVLPQVRRRGIGSRLMDGAEAVIATRSTVAGIGVGLYADYGAAQRLYVRRGYVPDGRGIAYNNVPVVPGSMVRADDGLVLYFTRTLTPLTSGQ